MPNLIDQWIFGPTGSSTSQGVSESSYLDVDYHTDNEKNLQIIAKNKLINVDLVNIPSSEGKPHVSDNAMYATKGSPAINDVQCEPRWSAEMQADPIAVGLAASYENMMNTPKIPDELDETVSSTSTMRCESRQDSLSKFIHSKLEYSDETRNKVDAVKSSKGDEKLHEKLKNELETLLRKDEIYEILSIPLHAKQIDIGNVCREHISALNELACSTEIQNDKVKFKTIAKLNKSISKYQLALQSCAEDC